MPRSKQKLCEWRKKDIQQNLPGLLEIIKEPKFICLNCGRAADSPDRLCKASAIH